MHRLVMLIVGRCMAPNLNFGVFPQLGWQIPTGSRRSRPRVSPEMNDSDLVLIRTSKFLGIGSLRKKLQPSKDHRKSENIMPEGEYP